MKLTRPWNQLVPMVVGLCLFGCWQAEIGVQRIGDPEYPALARMGGIQGTVEVGVQIGTDGKVMWAHGTGADAIPVKAAEENARQWIWGPFPARFSFPYYREVTYVFRLDGKPAAVVVSPSRVRTELPDRIEIIATPVYSGPQFVPSKPVPSHS